MADDGDDVKPKPENGEAGKESIQLKVKGQDGSELMFKVKKSTTFKKMFDAYAQKKGVEVKNIRFIFDGNRLKPEDTPDSRDMEDGDEIDVMIEQLGGGVAGGR